MARTAVSALRIANTVLATASSGLAATAAARPDLMSYSKRPPSAGETFYSRMYASRGIPLGLLAAVTPWLCPGRAATLALVAAAAAQVGDAAIGAGRRERRMIVGAGTLAAVHLTTAAVMW